MQYPNKRLVGVVHAKGNSERIVRKNLCLVQGVPLFLWQAQNLASLCGKDHVFVDSDNAEILQLSRQNGFQVFERDRRFATNSTGGVELLRNFLNNFKNELPDTVIQAFPPGPLMDLEELRKGIFSVHESRECNSAFFMGATRLYGWNDAGPQYGDFGYEIPNGIDLEEQKFELPTVYIVNSRAFLKNNSRVCSPRKELVLRRKEFEIDVDNQNDFLMLDSVLSNPIYHLKFPYFEKLRLYYPPIIFWDVDGTLTNGFFNSDKSGELFKSFHTFDGIAMNELSLCGVKNVVISASMSNSIIEERCSMFGWDVRSNVQDKASVCTKIANENGYNLRECYYVGNDVNDLQVMAMSGRSFCPLDADERVLRYCTALPLTASQGGIVRQLKRRLEMEKAMERKNVA